MDGNNQEKSKHFILNGFADPENFTRPPQTFTTNPVPARDRQLHGTALLANIQLIRPLMASAKDVQEDAGLTEGYGLQVEFEGFADVQLAFESLSREHMGIELLNVKHQDNKTLATVFVPDGKLDHFEKMLRDYLIERRTENGQLRDNHKLVNAISEIRVASLKALWTDSDEAFPQNDDDIFWWEVWLPIRQDRMGVINTFCQLAERVGFELAPGKIEFPERTVLLARTSKASMVSSMMMLNSIAELRRAKETAGFFDALPPPEQPEWVNDLIERSQFSRDSEDVPYICLLDTGINRAHPLIAHSLSAGDVHSVEPAWGGDDNHGHGTAMAGLALMGDLTEVLGSTEPVTISHRLESVKLLPDDGANGDDGQHHGYLTAEAVARPEITAPNRRRVFSMAVTARDNRDRGRPSAWSATLDGLAADVDEYGNKARLLIVSAGNINDSNAWKEYPNSNATDGVHDPAQSWNVLTVGAFTEKVEITEDDTDNFLPIAQDGDLSPFSTTSQTWQDNWPLKPEVVFEGGNAAQDTISAVCMPSLFLLTTNHNLTERLLSTANATSAATALASRMAAQLMSAYPQLRPESIRGLMVHSAQWTEAMRQMFLSVRANPTKADYLRLVRHCGFGVPNLDRALWSVSNSLTLLAEDRLFPYKREGTNEPTLREMNLYKLPWPVEELEALGTTPVEMRVTLSYFIEPNPSERGIRSRYRYESHGLRFDVKRPTESEQEFRSRINAAARDEEEGTRPSTNDDNWLIGTQGRHKGSLHSDIWHGTAVELASRGVIAIYPTVGWWKTRKKMERYDNAAKYTLIVSIHVPEVDIDLLTPIANQLTVQIAG
jgi:hypothetical protein